MDLDPLRRDEIHLHDEKHDPRSHQNSVDGYDRTCDRRCVEKWFEIKRRAETDQYRDNEKHRDRKEKFVVEVSAGSNVSYRRHIVYRDLVDRHKGSLRIFLECRENFEKDITRRAFRTIRIAGEGLRAGGLRRLSAHR